ncbi:tetratricopeptide repeat protein [Spirochaeta dissipatitropha]
MKTGILAYYKKHAAFGLVSILLLTGCSFTEPHLSVFQGNYAVGRGDFHAATVSYLDALQYGEFLDIIHYNLGNVYYALGESVAALDAWEQALGSDSTLVQYSVFFNRGVLMYETGRYQESYTAFRDAVRLQPGSVAAKLNLELSYERMINAAALRSPAETSEDNNLPSLQAGDRRVLEFVRRREEQAWERNNFSAEAVTDW